MLQESENIHQNILLFPWEVYFGGLRGYHGRLSQLWEGKINLKEIHTYIFSLKYILKVRQNRNDFFKQMFLPKNEQMNSTMYYDFFLFLEEIEDTKKTFRN